MMASSQDTKSEQIDFSCHHYSLTFSTHQICDNFKNVKIVLLTDCSRRADAQLDYLSKKLFNYEQGLPVYKPEKLTTTKSRFSLSKIGPVLVSDCGFGRASMSIALHELLLMCKQAGIIENIKVIRFGTCRGIGVKAGSICIANRVLNSQLQDYVDYSICFKMVRRQCVIDLEMVKSIESAALGNSNHELLGQYDVEVGATVGTDDHYEEQGRLDGAICDHTQQDRQAFLHKLESSGVIGMDLDSNFISAMCHKLNVKYGLVSIAISNELVDDEIKLSDDTMSKFEERLFWLNLVLVRDIVLPPVGPSSDYVYTSDDGTCGGMLCVEPCHLRYIPPREPSTDQD